LPGIVSPEDAKGKAGFDALEMAGLTGLKSDAATVWPVFSGHKAKFGQLLEFVDFPTVTHYR
jgi:hypothetical protein